MINELIQLDIVDISRKIIVAAAVIISSIAYIVSLLMAALLTMEISEKVLGRRKKKNDSE